MPSRAEVAERLAQAGCIAADEETEELMAAAADDLVLEAYLRRRESGEPLAWITGQVRFCGHVVRVDPGVYVPRVQSEELARRAGALIAGPRERRRAADLCAGSGAVGVHLRSVAPGATIVSVDADRRAVRCARRNGLPAVLGDLGRALRSASFDVVTAVAPYVPTTELAFLPADVLRYEPRRALDGGRDGLDVVRRAVASAARLLHPGGWLLVEVGAGQDRLLAPTLAATGFGPATTWLDEDGDLRGLAARAAAA